ncbi:MAG TPA: DUF2085 domain-containing protein [Anaerolineales bacterium]|nr:DUF2085 domain-containing protein [Anaerolineales bacterium]
MADAPSLNVTLYARAGCKLCDEVREQLSGLQARYPHRLVEIDIDSDPVLQKTYLEQIPVVEVGPYKLKAPISPQALEMTLGAASDRRGQLQNVGGEEYQERVRKGQTATGSDGFYLWISKHYLAMLNIAMLLYVGLPFVAPTLLKLGASDPARIIYTIYSPLCHQFAFRSFFLFGEQPYYPLKEAGLTGVKTLEDVSGIKDLANPFSISRLYAREFVGDATVGYKIAICERDIAIYGSILLFGLLYGLTHRRWPALHWMLWLAIGLAPIALDGFSQLFSQMNWPWLAAYLPYRESTPFLRVFTGALFGFATAWFAFPNIEASMRETRQFFIKKDAVARAAQ